MKKILAILLMLALMCGMLAACSGSDPEALIAKADEALADAPYKVTMKMNFDCDNEELNTILSAMNMELPVIVDGKNVSIVMSMDMMGESFSATATVVDNVMYYDLSVAGQSIKMKASMNEEQYKKFMEEQNTSMVVNPEDFATLTVEKKDGKNHIACGEITEEGLKKINDMVADTLGAGDAEAEFNNISYDIILEDGKYDSMILNCDYAVTIEGVSYNMDFQISAEFTYDNIGKIVVPSDAASYTEVNYDDIMS